MAAVDVHAPDPSCIFCKIVAGDIPAKIALKTDVATVFHDLHPQAPTHLLIIPNRHTPSHAETQDPQIFAEVMAAAQQAAQQEGLKDYRLVINNGPGAGQSVFHLHVHLLARRAMQWPPG
jgi:histidine triad (HIT) family protein